MTSQPMAGDTSHRSPPGLSADTLVIACGVVAALHVGKLPPALPVLRDALGVSLKAMLWRVPWPTILCTGSEIAFPSMLH